MRILPAENLRVPGPGDSAQGKSDPNARPKGVVDGQQVNIPVLEIGRLTDGVTEKGSRSGCWISRFKQVGCVVGKSATREGRDVMTSASEVCAPMLPRKTS